VPGPINSIGHASQAQEEDMTRRTIGIAIALATLGLSPASTAAAEPMSRRVSTAGLDLSSPADQETVQKRIKRAAWSICKPDDMFVSLSTELDARRCVKEAIAAAQPQLDQAVVIASARRRQADSLALASRR
jgi:UrcA family protein